MKTLTLAFAVLLPLGNALAADHLIRRFEKIQLTDQFFAEGSGIGDFDQDGHTDAVVGPYWYAGPDFQTKHEIYPVEAFDPKGYSNNFITFVHDVNEDGYPDVLANLWPGKEVVWYENPGKENSGEHWTRHVAFDVVDNESPQFGDINGDGEPELVFHTRGILGYAEPDPADPTAAWTFHGISERGEWQRYTHGIGFGDVDGDGKADFLMREGWWKQTDGTARWTPHRQPFGSGGAQMHTYDIDGDGDQDVITSLAAHGYGLAWFEQVERDGKIEFKQHLIMGEKPSDNAFGVKFSQPHAVELVDIDGDGLQDIVSGKRFWAHGPNGDAEPGAPAVLYWFQLTRDDEGNVEYIPHLIDDDSGVGTQFSVGDLNDDGLPDVVIGNKKGSFVMLQQTTPATQAEWESAQPKRTTDSE